MSKQDQRSPVELAIADSVFQAGRCQYLPLTEDAQAELSCLCDRHIEHSDGEHEYRGTTEDGDEWIVLLEVT